MTVEKRQYDSDVGQCINDSVSVSVRVFMKRNPSLSFKKPEHLQKARQNARDPFVVYDFFERVEDIYSKSSIHENAALLVFNADETGFTSDPSRLRAIGEKGKALNRVSGGSGRESTTVLACESARGDFLPPLIVHKGIAVQPRWISSESYPGTIYAATNNGWMKESTFYDWFLKMFIPTVNEIRQNNHLEGRTAVLFYDGHSSHISIRIIEQALENKIELLKFPSHLTDRIQPLDKCVFGPVKTAWDKILVEHGKTKMGFNNSRLSKAEFVQLLSKLWKNLSRKNIIKGFNSTGLFPL